MSFIQNKHQFKPQLPINYAMQDLREAIKAVIQPQK